MNCPHMALGVDGDPVCECGFEGRLCPRCLEHAAAGYRRNLSDKDYWDRVDEGRQRAKDRDAGLEP